MNFEKLYMFGISRVDSMKGHYWLVRIWKQKHVLKAQKVFSDTSYGDRDKSLHMAKKFRDDNLTIKHIKHLTKTSQCKLHREYYTTDERQRLRVKAIEIHGPNKLYLGTGIDAAVKAREMGFSKVVCCRLNLGRQNSINLNNIGRYIPNLNMSWQDRTTGKRSDITIQKSIGKKHIVLGTGLEAALEAKKLGASQSSCLAIKLGKKDFFQSCSKLPHYEANGFKRSISKEVEHEVKVLLGRYAPNDATELLSEILLNYAGRDEIPSNPSFIRNLVFRYIKIFKISKCKEDYFDRLDLDGNVVHEYEGDDYVSKPNIDERYLSMYDLFD